MGLQSDIVSLEAYMKQKIEQDPILKTLVLETSNDPYEMERFDAVSNSESFSYPAVAMLMPVISGSDNGMHNFEAYQELGFAILFPTDGTLDQKLECYKKGQQAGWRLIQAMRADSKKGMFRIEQMSYKMAPFDYGSDNCVGQYVVITLITGTNSLIGS